MVAFFKIGKIVDPQGWTLYTSLEPCLMCGGAIGMLGLRRVVWACDDPWGGSGRLIRWNEHPAYTRTQVTACPFPDLEQEAATLFAPEAKSVYGAEGWQRWRERYPQICARFEDAPQATGPLRELQAEIAGEERG